MSNMEFDKEKKSKNRGFYIALGICIIALAAAIYIGVTTTLQKLSDESTLDLDDTASTTASEPVQDVDNTQSAVPVESTAPASEEAQPTAEEAEQEKPQALSFTQPVDGDILNAYSNGELVKSKTLNEWRTHDGIDIKAVANTPVKAAADGLVEEITEDPMWGVCITMSHEGNYQTFYKGLKPTVDVKVGQKLKLGEIIGYVGNTAEIEIAEDSHMHFAVKKDGSWVDPTSLF